MNPEMPSGRLYAYSRQLLTALHDPQPYQHRWVWGCQSEAGANREGKQASLAASRLGRRFLSAPVSSTAAEIPQPAGGLRKWGKLWGTQQQMES